MDGIALFKQGHQFTLASLLAFALRPKPAVEMKVFNQEEARELRRRKTKP